MSLLFRKLLLPSSISFLPSLFPSFPAPSSTRTTQIRKRNSLHMFQRHLSQLLRGSRYPLQRERATLGSQIARDDLESLVDRTIRERDALPKAFFTTVRASRSSSFALEDASEGLSSLLHTFKGSGSDSSSSNRYASLKDGRHAAWRRSFASCAPETHSTTVLCVRKDGEVVVVADGKSSSQCPPVLMFGRGDT